MTDIERLELMLKMQHTINENHILISKSLATRVKKLEYMMEDFADKIYGDECSCSSSSVSGFGGRLS